MNFSAVSMLRSIAKIPLFLLIIPYTLSAMEEENASTHDHQHIFTKPFEIKAIAKFHTLNQREKDFARYIRPFRIYHDDDGNVHFVDTLNISVQTDDYPPMFKVRLNPSAINLAMNKMKLSCTIFNQYNANRSVTVEMMLSLNESTKFDVPLGLMDETGKPVSLVIETTAQE